MSIIYPLKQFPYTFPFTFGQIDGAIQVEDYDPVYFLQPAIDAHTTIANMPYFVFQAEPTTFLFDAALWPSTGQQRQETLMPIYDTRYLFGDISNMPYFTFQSFDQIHFGPNGVDTFQGPATFNILEGPADFELRTPE